ncbi:conserved hypothetical protein [Histoplasma capsulatum H143]|uniref:Uncharacterized protein n=1 Tax=Ajellomyces capsulatus (strain H143) TaxID=544712 RepID=C6HEV3_AJECH|nr:conserved hypothetical protein [Histoplasma capsulatum H143]
MFRRKRSSAHAPLNSNPSPSAQTAAAQAFRASQANAALSTAAAAAALRTHTSTPTSVENVQTKPGSSERDISPVPPIPQSFLAHQRAVSLESSSRAINPVARSSRSPDLRKPSSPRSPRALSSLPELERQDSRSSINFSYPTHARPNSPPQSPIQKLVAKPLVSDDDGMGPDEGLSQNHIVARSSKSTTTPITAAAKGAQSYPDLSAFHTEHDESKRPRIGATHAITETEASTSPEEQDPAHSHHMPSTIHGEDAEQDRHPSPKSSQTKARIIQQYGNREVETKEQQITDPSEVHDPKTNQTDQSTDSGSLPKFKYSDSPNADVENDKTSMPTGFTVDTSPSTDFGSTSHTPLEALSIGHAHDTVSASTEGRNNERPHSISPTRTTHFSSHLVVSLSGERLHDPPPRSMSPAKSALKHPTPQSSPGNHNSNDWSKSLQAQSESPDGTSVESDDGQRDGNKKRTPKVSFEDEPEEVGASATASISQGPGSPISSSPLWGPGSKNSSLARNGYRFNTRNGNDEDAFNEVMKPRPALPSFGSIRGRRWLIEDHDKRQVHDRPSSPRTSGSGNAFGEILHQSKHSRPQDSNSFVPGNPIPPEVTSVEGTGYDSPSETSSSSEDLEDPDDYAHPGDITSSPPSEVQKASSESLDVGGKAVRERWHSENIPIISIHPATPALAEENISGEWARMPGWFPSPMALPEHEMRQNIDNTRQPRPVIPDSTSDARISSIPYVDGDESDSSESVYSDAAENLSDLEGDGFGSINAIVDSPVSHVSSYSHTPPPDSPTNSKVDKKWPSDISLRFNEPRTSAPLGSVYTSTPLPVEERVSTSAVSSNKNGNTEDGGSLHNITNQQLHPKSGLHELTSTSLSGAAVASAEASPTDSGNVAPNGQQTYRSVANNHNAAKQKKPRSSKSSKRTPGDKASSHDKGLTSQKGNDSFSTKNPIENGHSTSGAAPGSDFGFASKGLAQSTAYDSDSSSSFKRVRRSPRGATRYTLKRTLRGPSDARPYSSGGYSIGIGGRSTLPTSQQRPFSSDHNLPIRTTLRGLKNGVDTKSSFANFGRSSKPKRAPSGLNTGAKSKFSFSHSNDDDVGFSPPFRSRYEDSSDDDVVPMSFSPVRGIPKRKDGVDGDSTDLEDSSDEEIPKRVLRRPDPRRLSIIPSMGQPKPVPSLDTITNGTRATDATDEPTSVIPNEPGAFFPQLPKRQGSIFSRLGRSKYRGSDDTKIRKSELDSAVRRDSPLERSHFELWRNRGSRSSRNGRSNSPSSGAKTNDPHSQKEAAVEKGPVQLVGSGSWPLSSHTNSPVAIGSPISPIPEKGESDTERPNTANNIATNNGTTTSCVSISGPPLLATPESSSNWTSRFRPRLHNRRGTNSSTISEDSSGSSKPDAGLGLDEKKKRKKLSLLKKAFGISSTD